MIEEPPAVTNSTKFGARPHNHEPREPIPLSGKMNERPLQRDRSITCHNDQDGFLPSEAANQPETHVPSWQERGIERDGENTAPRQRDAGRCTHNDCAIKTGLAKGDDKESHETKGLVWGVNVQQTRKSVRRKEWQETVTQAGDQEVSAIMRIDLR